MERPPGPPRITFPHGRTTTLRPHVAWMGDAHDACEVRIGRADDPQKADVWRSREIDTVEWCLVAGPLPADSKLHAFVRLRSSAGWGLWSEGAAFETPSSPIVKIEQPVNAGRARGPNVEVSWRVESETEDIRQSISIDGGKFQVVDPEARSFAAGEMAEGVHRAVVRVQQRSGTAEDAVTFYVYRPVQLLPINLYTLDLRELHSIDLNDPQKTADAFDTLHLAAALQGIVNRNEPRLYINYTKVDQFWLEKIREPGGYLEHATLVPLQRVEDAVAKFSDRIRGAVLWDPDLPCTSNIASTICGVEDLLPIRFDESPGSMYDRLVANGPKLPVVRNLVGRFTGSGTIPDWDIKSTGSAKCDAYLWAKMQYVDTGKCNPTEIGYYCDAFWIQHPKEMSLDNVGLTNHDFIIARRGFLCDLDVWPDESPRDDPNQKPGLDRQALLEILRSCYAQSGGGKMIHFCGFTPWIMKYTNAGSAGGRHEPVPTEWETARLVSAYNGFMDADAIGLVGMANASVFAHCKLPDRLVQNPPPTRADLEAEGYIDAAGNVAALNFVYHYLGDYDSAAWMYNRLPDLWQNPVRGQVPSGWAFNPNLIERLPVAFEWIYKTKTPSDYFIAGDSGAGYVNPTQLLPDREPSGLASGAAAWIAHNVAYYRKLNYSITGFLINGFCGELTEDGSRMYVPFSGDGVMTHINWMPGANNKKDHLLRGMVVAGMKQDITGPLDAVAQAILKYGRPGQTQFLSFRSILVGPDWIKAVNNEMRRQRPDCRFEPVDPYTYFYLLKHTLGGVNEMRATYTFDTLSEEIDPGRRVSVTVGIRNDGWDVWQPEGPEAVVLRASFDGRSNGVDIPLKTAVGPGEGTVISFAVQVPKEAGNHEFRLELRRGRDGYFSGAGDLPWMKAVAVRSASEVRK